jgi:DNA repair exonuclease SbcCD nuclease subunit
MMFAGIGDLHLDGRLSKHIPELNAFIMNEVRSVVQKAQKKGCRVVVFYGDIGDKPQLSDEAHMMLLDLFREFTHMKFVMIAGNHDRRDVKRTGLDLLTHMALSNLRVVKDHPTMLFKNTDHPVNFMPWPFHKEVEESATNVVHIEVAGSFMDSGRPFGGGHKIPSKCFCVAGHLHTMHKAGKNVHYSGTLYQTYFGEKEAKYWHLVDTSERTVETIKHSPRYVLRNIVIEKPGDLEDLIPDNQDILCKLFVKSNVALHDGVLDKYPNIIKHNTFKTKSELEALVMSDFVIDDHSGTVQFDLEQALGDWMVAEGVDAKMQKAVHKANKELLVKRGAIAV